MKGSEIIKVTLHKADGVLYPVAGRKDKVVITLSGSEGRLEHAEKLAKYLQDNGIPAFALGYFKTKHSVKTLNKIELENIKAAIEWLKKLGYEKIGIEGCSKGAEYAAAAAIAFHELSCVILKIPSWFYSQPDSLLIKIYKVIIGLPVLGHPMEKFIHVVWSTITGKRP